MMNILTVPLKLPCIVGGTGEAAHNLPTLLDPAFVSDEDQDDDADVGKGAGVGGFVEAGEAASPPASPVPATGGLFPAAPESESSSAALFVLPFVPSPLPAVGSATALPAPSSPSAAVWDSLECVASSSVSASPPAAAFSVLAGGGATG